jgi:hypothetical protein
MGNPAHLLLGPVFVMAKRFIALGFRDDLAAVMAQVPQAITRGSLLSLEGGLHPNS